MARLTISDLEIERKDESFEFEMPDGRVFVLADPKTIHAKELAVLERLPVATQLRLIAGEKGDELLAYPEVDGYVFEGIMRAYRAHYGLGTAPEAPAS